MTGPGARRICTSLAALLASAPLWTFPIASTAGSTALDPLGVWPTMPVPVVVHGFDPPSVSWGPGHRGVDLAGRVGQPVRAALAGRITFSGILAGRGVVVVDHGETRTTYEPVVPSLARGTLVVAGQRIGWLAAQGSHCLPTACLHWGWLRGETYLDPLRLVGPGPVRLLPLWAAFPTAEPLARVLLGALSRHVLRPADGLASRHDAAGHR